jgi:hypothetical protein
VIIEPRIEDKHLESKSMMRYFEGECNKMKPSRVDGYNLETVYLTCPEIEGDIINQDKVDHKYRMRYYPEIREGFDTRIFAEIKSKDGDIRYKRAVPVGISESMAIMQGNYRYFNGLDRDSDRYEIINEYRDLGLTPALSIKYYRRVYMFDQTRVTIDSDITATLCWDFKVYSIYEGKIIIEFKGSHNMSSKAIRLQEGLGKSCQLSKYKSARRVLGI